MTPDFSSLPDPEAATAISQHIREWDEAEPLRYAGIGLMAVAVEKRLLWQYVVDPADGMPCRSFSRWIRVVAPAGYSTVYAAKKDIEELHDVPAADLAQIPQSNLVTMKQLSTKVRGDEKVLDIAKHGRTEQLVDYIREHHADQHLEARKVLKFTPDESAAAKIEEALAEAENHGARGRNDALELICATVMEIWRMEAEVERAHEDSEKTK
jgi:hypothetical protein